MKTITKEELKADCAKKLGCTEEELNGCNLADVLQEVDSFPEYRVFWGLIPSAITTDTF